MIHGCGLYVKSRMSAPPAHRTLFLGFAFILVSLTAAAQASPQSVFVKATCSGKCLQMSQPHLLTLELTSGWEAA